MSFINVERNTGKLRAIGDKRAAGTNVGIFSVSLN
jgi:hypothetical protein